jgi:hypothetical protein
MNIFHIQDYLFIVFEALWIVNMIF